MYLFLTFCVFFFFKQKTAYDMRISDWSSDVCSSDLFRYDERFSPLSGRGKAPGPACYHGAGGQSYLGPASLVHPGTPEQAGFALSRLVCLERHRPDRKSVV